MAKKEVNVQFNVRVPPSTVKMLEQAGKERGVTAATEANIRLRESFDDAAREQEREKAVAATISSTAEQVAQQVSANLMKQMEQLIVKIVRDEITKRSS
jgi:hypothetical protein